MSDKDLPNDDNYEIDPIPRVSKVSVFMADEPHAYNLEYALNSEQPWKYKTTLLHDVIP